MKSVPFRHLPGFFTVPPWENDLNQHQMWSPDIRFVVLDSTLGRFRLNNDCSDCDRLWQFLGLWLVVVASLFCIDSVLKPLDLVLSQLICCIIQYSFNLKWKQRISLNVKFVSTLWFTSVFNTSTVLLCCCYLLYADSHGTNSDFCLTVGC